MISNIEQIENSLLEKELIVKRFFSPKFIKIKDSLILIKFLNGSLLNQEKEKYNLNNLYGSEEVAIFKKYSTNITHTKFKDNAALFEDLSKKNTNNLTNNFNLMKNYKTKDFSIINKEPKIITVLENDIQHNNFNENSKLFHSYLEKLKRITNDIEKLNKAKLKRNSKYNNLKNDNISSFSSYKYVKDNSNFASNSSNSLGYTYNQQVISHKNSSPNKSNVLNMNNYYSEKKDSQVISNTANSNLRDKLNKSSIDLDKYNKLSENYTNLIDKQHYYNEFISKISGKIDELANKLIPYFDEFNNKLNVFNNKENLIDDSSINNNFSNLNDKITEIKNLCDLNGVDIDKLSDLLSPIDFNELIKLLKDMNVNIHTLMNKQAKLTQDETEVSNEIKSLESKLKIYNQEQLDNLIRQISILEKKQSEYSLNQEENKNIIVNEIKNILHIFNSKTNTTNELQERLNNILNKQESLFQEAVNIKNYIVNNNKKADVVEDKSNKGLHVLIEEIKSNNNVVKEQSVFNEKIHKDMEIIKKSIIKLIDEQARENNKNLNYDLDKDKTLKENVYRRDANPITNQHNANVESAPKYNNAEINENISNNKLKNNREIQKASQIKMAIGKLKEALDLDSIHTVKELHTEYIDEIIEDKIAENNLKNVQNNIEKSSITTVKDQNKSNVSELKTKEQESNKSFQSTFVLDNSKFFK